jgi:ankyrin repeat protein
MAGLRVDQRGSVMKARRRRVNPGSAETSFLYLRLSSDEFGPRMPPTGPLASEQIAVLKDWIDQGAEWPDALAGDPPPPPPPDPLAVRLAAALRDGDRKAFRRMLRAEPKAGGLVGPGGATVLMHAVLYGGPEEVRLLLEGGADPNRSSPGGSTALMWATGEVALTRLLLDHGAAPNLRAEQGQTALGVAAGRAGSIDVVRLLLDRGADASGPGGAIALRQAASAGDPDVFRLLLARGAPANTPNALTLALRSGCGPCVEAVIGSAEKGSLDAALVMLAPFGDAGAIRTLLDRGADVDALVKTGRRDFRGRTPLLLAASSDFLPVDAVRTLLDRGASLGARGPDGETALDLAERNGPTRVVDLLTAVGATKAWAFSPTGSPHPRPAPSVSEALGRSLPLLQQTDATFLRKAACVSCHHNSITAMTVGVARARGLAVDEEAARSQRTRVAGLVEAQREDALLGIPLTNTVAAGLVALAAAGHPPDLATDAMAALIRARQLPDGRWREAIIDHRPPIQGGDIEVTAAALRGLRVYAPRARRREYEETLQRGRDWLASAPTRTTDDLALKLLGLHWAGARAGHAAIRDAARLLSAAQRPDGGWAQLPTLESDAYATGQVLYALAASGAVEPGHSAFRRGVRFLLDTQLADGSWHVRTRALPFQAYFESGFPHGPDQWISTAATSWASMALAVADRRMEGARP